MGAPDDTPILVHHVKQEYWHIAKQKCPCGGQLKCGAQQVAEQADMPVDVIQTECNQCGREKEFRFNIASFFGTKAIEEQEQIRQVARHVRSETLKEKLPLLAGSPVVHTVNTILDLGKRGDRLALDWIADAVGHAQRESETTGSEEKRRRRSSSETNTAMLAHLHVTLADLSSGYQECLGRLREPEIQRESKKRFNDLRRTFRSEAISYCIDNFIFSELDTRSKKRTGVGRLSDEVPRLGGICADELAVLSPDSLRRLGEKIKDVIVCGYVLKAILSESANPLYDTDRELYDVWMPQIYLVDDPISDAALGDSCRNRFQALIAYMDEIRLNLANSDGSPATRLVRIVSYYGCAGLVLRQCEVTPYEQLDNPIPGAPRLEPGTGGPHPREEHRLGCLSDDEIRYAQEHTSPSQSELSMRKLSSIIPDKQVRNRLIAHMRGKCPGLSEAEIYDRVIGDYMRDRR